MACVGTNEAHNHRVDKLLKLNGRQLTREQARLFSDTAGLHLASRHTERANPALASAAQASSKWMDVTLADGYTHTHKLMGWGGRGGEGGSDSPHGSVSAGADRRQVLVPLRDFPYRLIDVLSVKRGSLFMRHSCRSHWRPPTWLSALRWLRVVQPPWKLYPKLRKEKPNRTLVVVEQLYTDESWSAASLGNVAESPAKECALSSPQAICSSFHLLTDSSRDFTPLAYGLPSVAKSRERTRGVRANGRNWNQCGGFFLFVCLF